jgi:nitroreductase
MELREILKRRRMHRAFLPDPIPGEQIERIAGVIRRAPSGGFSQGGSIVSVNESLYHARYNEVDKLSVTGGVEVTWPVPYWFVDAGR